MFLAALAAICGIIPAFEPSALADPIDVLLVRRSKSATADERQVQSIRLTAINEQHIEHLPADKSWERIPLSDSIALLNPAVAIKPRTTGLLMLADGQRLPGEIVATTKTNAEALAWTHPWLGQMEVPLNLVEAALLTPTATMPAAGQEDVVLLANGDRREGLIISWGAAITLESGRGAHKQITEIPLNLVTAIRMVAGKSSFTARRLWFDDGTVLDVQSIAVGEDGMLRLSGTGLLSGGAGTQPTRAGLAQIAAILFHPQGMIPLASLTPARVEGPPTRYQLPKPLVTNGNAPLALSDIEFSGPIIARYALPIGAHRLYAEAELPRDAQQWGDYELIIRSNDSEVFRTRLNATKPTATINVALAGRELTIELSEGENGPIQDRLILHRPMLLMKTSQ